MMTRIVAIISFCLAALLLMPVQGQCSEVSESEMDPEEVECCVISCQERQTVPVRKVLKVGIVRKSKEYRDFATVALSAFKPVPNLGILYCILRE